MQAYVVRFNAKQKHPRELVGFFVAESIPQLYDLIDECCDVDRVEIMELGPGGIYWSNPVNHVVPHPEEIIEDAPGLPGDASVSELWIGALFDENGDQWEPADLDLWHPDLKKLASMGL